MTWEYSPANPAHPTTLPTPCEVVKILKMEIMLTQFILYLSWIICLCIVLLGAWVVLNYVVWDILIKYSFRYLKVYKLFIHFIIYHKRYFAWVKKYEGKIEEGAND